MVCIKNLLFRLSIIATFPLLTFCTGSTQNFDDDVSIQTFSGNPFYWQYKGEPKLLLGGSWQDNLFNHPSLLEEHLDVLVAAGGNYLRNTMSHRNAGNIFAYVQRDGKFDLDEFNPEYWERFDNFLRMTYDRDIIVQIEIFDPWDRFAESFNAQSLGGWSKHPFTPADNGPLTGKNEGLSEVVFEEKGALPHHVHHRDEHAKLTGQEGKPKAYFFPFQLNNHGGDFPYTFFGFNPGTSREEELLWKDTPKDKIGDFDHLLEIIDWELNVDPDFVKNRQERA